MKAVSRWKLLVLLLSTGTLLGLTTVLMKVSSGAGIPALPYLSWSAAAAALILAMVYWRGRTPHTPSRRVLEYHVVAGGLSFAVPNAILVSAIPHVGAGFAALTLTFPPALTYLGAVLLRIEKVDRWRALAVACALAGAAILASSKDANTSVPLQWVLLTLIVPVVLAAGNIYRSVRWPPGETPCDLAPGLLLASAIMLIGAGLTPAFPLVVRRVDPLTVALLCAQAMVFALQYILFFRLQREGGPVYLSLIGAVAAVVAVPLSLLLFDESLPPHAGEAAALVFAAAALMVWTNYSRVSRPR